VLFWIVQLAVDGCQPLRPGGASRPHRRNELAGSTGRVRGGELVDGGQAEVKSGCRHSAVG
jgi:hypothetical protein